MQFEVQVKEPGNVTSRVNQVSIQYYLYEWIKEAHQGDDGIRKILEKVQGGKIQGFTCDKGMLKFGHRVCHKMQGLRRNLRQKLITLPIRYIQEQQRCIKIFEQIS